MKSSLGYLASVSISLYATVFLLKTLFPGFWFDPNTALTSVYVLLCIAYTISRLFNDATPHEGRFWDCLVYTGATLSVVTLTTPYVVANGPPWMENTPPSLLPIYAILLWTGWGLLFFHVILAKAYELSGARTLPAISLTLVLLYNFPLLTGEWHLDDVLFLGVIFPIIYHFTRSSAGLVISYVLLYERPVLMAFLEGWGYSAFVAVLSVRVAWELICLIYLLLRLLTS